MGKNDNWLTPPEIIEALGPFDLDPCAMENQPWTTAARHYTIRDNGLLMSWAGRVWLNPPYSKPKPWLIRLAEHNIGTALVFAVTDTKMFFEAVYEKAMMMMFLRGRLSFKSLTGADRFRSPSPSVLIAYGEQDTDMLAESGLDGKLVLLGNQTQVVAAIPVQTWKELVTGLLKRHGELSLRRLYALVADHPKTQGNLNWQAKIRQQVQMCGFERVAPGVYRLQSA